MFICKCRLEETKLEEQKIDGDCHLLEQQLRHEVDKVKVKMIIWLLSASNDILLMEEVWCQSSCVNI